MFCPKCKVEYRSGFARCSDCEVDLVGTLPDDDSDEASTLIWECADRGECVEVCEELRTGEVACRVDEIVGEKLAKMNVEWIYRILISPDDLERAKEVLRIDGPQNTVPSSETDDEEVVDPAVELADAGVPLTGEGERRDAYLDLWYPEDATVEVWSQHTDDLSEGIERSLDANCIHSRCDADGSGGKKIFVRPEDESFAREIIREIIEGTPLE